LLDTFFAVEDGTQGQERSMCDRVSRIRLIAVLVGCLFPQGVGGTPEGITAGQAHKDYPQTTLTNGILTLRVMLPDAENGYYRGTRFDWSGVVSLVKYKEHVFFGEWKTTHDATNHDDIAGPVDEFGMFVPLGYNEAKVGEPFVKIGVGILTKVAEPEYRFWYPYKIIRPGTWKVDSGPDWIEFRQNLGSGNLGYFYTKKILLRKGSPSFTIAHRLKNTGKARLSTNQYCHNFTMIDNQPIGSQYRLAFPFKPEPQDKAGLRGVGEFTANNLLFRREIKDGESLFAKLKGLTGRVTDNAVTVENAKTHAGLHIKGNVAVTSFNLFAAPLAVCPEPFIQIELEPGQEKAWEASYEFFTR
jgi:hypothetical protein